MNAPRNIHTPADRFRWIDAIRIHRAARRCELYARRAREMMVYLETLGQRSIEQRDGLDVRSLLVSALQRTASTVDAYGRWLGGIVAPESKSSAQRVADFRDAVRAAGSSQPQFAEWSAVMARAEQLSASTVEDAPLAPDDEVIRRGVFRFVSQVRAFVYSESLWHRRVLEQLGEIPSGQEPRERARRHRQKRKAGIRHVGVPVDVNEALLRSLVDAGYLTDEETGHRGAVADAMQSLVGVFAARLPLDADDEAEMLERIRKATT